MNQATLPHPEVLTEVAQEEQASYLSLLWKRYKQHKMGFAALLLLLLFFTMGLYAPFLASSLPLMVEYRGTYYFPLFHYLFSPSVYSTLLDRFFNLLMLIAPFMLLASRFIGAGRALVLAVLLQMGGMALLESGIVPHPILKRTLSFYPTWQQTVDSMTPYEKLLLLINERNQHLQHTTWRKFVPLDHEASQLPTPYERTLSRELQSQATSEQEAQYWKERRAWVEQEEAHIHHFWMPLLRPWHWEDDTGGSGAWNQLLPWWENSRLGHRDFAAALIFGVRISYVVGLLSVAVALTIGLPLGAISGFYGGWVDICICRLLEIWEAMPLFFILLFLVALLQTKSIFFLISIIGFFNWTGFSRYTRAEFFKQRNLSYVDAGRTLGFPNIVLMVRDILPNALPPVLTLVPFAMLSAITTEAGLSFLGLGEVGSCSWGVLMDEGRQAFPAQTTLLWPPALLLTALLMAIALVGDSLRDAMDPHVERE